jgi:hypothetical protein
MTVPAPPASASALSAVRPLPNGDVVGYMTVEGPWRLIEQTVRMAAAVGYVTEARDDSYAIIDVHNDNDDIIADYGVPTSRAWRWWYRKCGFRVAEEE